MSWQIYKIILQLCSPLHIGYGKTGNLQRTRPYITGRVLWGALTMRLTRDQYGKGVPVNDSRMYREVGEQIHRDLAFSYFYPALQSENEYKLSWPWEKENLFRHRFLSSYAGTALAYPYQSAARGMLRETEFISPYTLDEGKPVFLMGYVFEKEDCTLPWQKAIDRLQVGGERGYGWGKIKTVEISISHSNKLFGQEIAFKEQDGKPSVALDNKARLLAHTVAKDVKAGGDIEPLVGREWCSDSNKNRYAGQHIVFNNICFAPGSILEDKTGFLIDKFGVWNKLSQL